MTAKEIRTRLETYINETHETLQRTPYDDPEYWKINTELAFAIRTGFKVGFQVMYINGKYCVM